MMIFLVLFLAIGEAIYQNYAIWNYNVWNFEMKE